jgi:hypothetical protein
MDPVHFADEIVLSGPTGIVLQFREYLFTGCCETLLTVKYSITPVIRMLVTWVANYPDQLGPSGNFVKNSAAKLICLEITSSWIDRSLTSSSKSVSQTFSYCNGTTSFAWLKFFPPLPNMYKELCINVLFVCK